MDLSSINSVCSLSGVKEVLKLALLPKNTVFTIHSAEVKTTKFGEVILLELEKNKVFLPKRSTEVMRDSLEELRTKKYGIKVIGSRRYGKSLSPVFEIVSIGN